MKQLQNFIEQTQKYSEINPTSNMMNKGYQEEDPWLMRIDIIKQSEISILISIAVLALSILSYRDQTFYERDYELFFDNMGSYVIDDTQLSYTYKNCQSQFGKEFSLIYEYYWPGTLIGCDCSQGYNFKLLKDKNMNNIEGFFKQSFMLNRNFRQEMMAKGCNTVDQQQPTVFNSWNNDSYGRPFFYLLKERLEQVYKQIKVIVNLNKKLYAVLETIILCSQYELSYL